MQFCIKIYSAKLKLPIIISPLFGFYLVLITAIIMLISSNSSFIMWLCLEINILAFLPIISSEPGIAFENTIKYFIIQRCASIIFLFGVIFCLLIRNKFIIMKRLAIFVKLGASPFHGWFISILKRCSIWVLFLLSTIQKILPLLIIINIINLYRWLLFITLITIAVIFYRVPGAVTLNKVLGLSSMANLVWLLFRVHLSVKLILRFIFIYIILLLGIVFSTNTRNNTSLFQIEGLDNFSKLIFIFIFLSLGSLPPLLGFLIKLLVLKSMIFITGIPVIIVLVFTSLIILYTYISRFFYYIRIAPSVKLTVKTGQLKSTKLIFLASVFSFNLLMSFSI